MIEKLIILAVSLALFIYCLDSLVHAEETTLSDKIIHLCKTGYYKRDVSKLEADRLAEAFKQSAKKYNVRLELITAIGYWETVYRNNIGDDGRSLGIMQTGRQARNKCKCSMETVELQIDCGACWLRKGQDWCKSERGGLTAYATGKCEAVTAKQKRIVNLRLQTAEGLR